MKGSKAIAVVVASAAALLLGACSAKDGGGNNNLGVAGGTAFAPLAGTGGAGGAAGSFAGAAGFAGAAAGVGGGAGAAGVGGGGAGIGGAGGAAGSVAGTGGSDAGSDAGGMLPTGAIATLSGLGGQTLHGSAMFTQSGLDVALVVTLAECMDGIYPVHIHDAASCADANSLGEHWDTTRGEGIPAIVCDGGNGIQTHARMAGVAETTWSIATSAADDIIGKIVVVHGASAPVACGAIEAR